MPVLTAQFIRHADQGNPSDAPPLVGMIGRDGKSLLFDAPEPLALELKGYCADVAIDPSGRFGASTFPRGNRIAIWSLRDGKLVSLSKVRDSAGIAAGPHPGDFQFSTGFGKILFRIVRPSVPVVGGRTHRFDELTFDNHMTPLGRPL